MRICILHAQAQISIWFPLKRIELLLTKHMHLVDTIGAFASNYATNVLQNTNIYAISNYLFLQLSNVIPHAIK